MVQNVYHRDWLHLRGYPWTGIPPTVFENVRNTYFAFYFLDLHICSFLMSGFGVYLGRFLRFNSWDVLQPVNLINGILAELNIFALQFTLCFAAVILLLFFFYLSMVRLIHSQSAIQKF